LPAASTATRDDSEAGAAVRWKCPTGVTAAIAALLCAGGVAHQGDDAPAPAGPAAEARHAFRLWRIGLERDAARIDDQRRAAERQLGELSLELSRMQSRIVRLDSLARRLVDRAELDAAEFDFQTEPGIGGPEEFLSDSGDASGVDAVTRLLALQVDDRWRQLRVLEDLLKWRELDDAVRPEGRPVAAGYLSSRFGARIDPFTGRTAIHKGVDFAARRGTDVVAVAAGIVTWSGPRSSYGEVIDIDHGNEHVTRYAHNSLNLVDVGDVVTRGQTIAKLGSTGRATGPNLHFEVLQDGQAVNPLPYIE
jgi:murein DD-endopeptidase MepM/ murein hydrolase activator NlpD